MTKSPKEAAAAAEEIRVLQEQMKEMQRRLDALCAEQSADVEDVENDESSSQDAEPVSDPVRAQPCSDQAERVRHQRLTGAIPIRPRTEKALLT